MGCGHTSAQAATSQWAWRRLATQNPVTAASLPSRRHNQLPQQRQPALQWWRKVLLSTRAAVVSSNTDTISPLLLLFTTIFALLILGLFCLSLPLSLTSPPLLPSVSVRPVLPSVAKHFLEQYYAQLHKKMDSQEPKQKHRTMSFRRQFSRRRHSNRHVSADIGLISGRILAHSSSVEEAANSSNSGCSELLEQAISEDVTAVADSQVAWQQPLSLSLLPPQWIPPFSSSTSRIFFTVPFTYNTSKYHSHVHCHKTTVMLYPFLLPNLHAICIMIQHIKILVKICQPLGELGKLMAKDWCTRRKEIEHIKYWMVYYAI